MTIVATHLYKRRQDHRVAQTCWLVWLGLGSRPGSGHDKSRLSKLWEAQLMTNRNAAAFSDSHVGSFERIPLNSIPGFCLSRLPRKTEIPSKTLSWPCNVSQVVRSFIKTPPAEELVLRFISLSFSVFCYTSTTFWKRKNSFGLLISTNYPANKPLAEMRKKKVLWKKHEERQNGPEIGQLEIKLISMAAISTHI